MPSPFSGKRWPVNLKYLFLAVFLATLAVSAFLASYSLLACSPCLEASANLSFVSYNESEQTAEPQPESELANVQRFPNLPLRIARQPLDTMQQSYESYSTVVMTISANSPCNVLVFGCGRDSYMYYSANRMPGSRTVFLEDIPKWLEIARQNIDNDPNLSDAIKESIELKVINYTTNATEMRLLSVYRNSSAFEKISAVRYDSSLDAMAVSVILVDAPLGTIYGRSQSMFVARKVAYQSLVDFKLPFVHVFVHDINRQAEKHYANVMFGSGNYTLLNRTYDDEVFPDSGRSIMNEMRYYKLDYEWAVNHDLRQLAYYYGYQL